MPEQDTELARADHRQEEDDSDSHQHPIASLLYLDGEDEIEFPIYPGEELSIGRTTLCSYQIDDPLVSKRHFRIYSVIYDTANEFPPLIYCEDLESTNGTYLNDSCIGSFGAEKIGHLLNHGDVIEIKPSWRFRFEQPQDAPVPRSLPVSQDLQHFDDQFKVSDRVLGKGQYGSVYLAYELSMSTTKQLACKIVDIQQAVNSLQADNESNTSNVGQKRLKPSIDNVMRETKILSKLSHPNIINLKKTFRSSTHLYIFTELAPAGDLFSHIEANKGKLSDVESQVITRQICLAVQYLHKQGIVHRDIKPENILMMQKDWGTRVVLTDFGFANYIHKVTGRLLSKVGTSGYIAPEVDLIGQTNDGYTMAADLWSLGVLAIMMLTGNSTIPREEFNQHSQQEIASQFMAPHDPFTKERWHTLTPGAYDFIQKIVVMSPEKRMTIDQALNHAWFTEPAVRAKELLAAYQRVIRFWKKRNENDQVVEDLPGRRRYAEEDTAGPRLRRRLPDASASRYFNVDRHLGPKVTSNRQTILEQLNNSGGRFLASEAHRNTAGTQAPQSKPLVKDVDGRDIFGTSSTLPREGSPDLDEVVLVPENPIHNERIYGFDMSDSLREPEQQNPLSIRPRAPAGRKRSRAESENEEDRNMRDEVAKALPKYSSAKQFRDELVKKRHERELAALKIRHSSK